MKFLNPKRQAEEEVLQAAQELDQDDDSQRWNTSGSN